MSRIQSLDEVCAISGVPFRGKLPPGHVKIPCQVCTALFVVGPITAAQITERVILRQDCPPRLCARCLFVMSVKAGASHLYLVRQN